VYMYKAAGRLNEEYESDLAQGLEQTTAG